MIKFLLLFAEFFKIGLFTFGGGVAMIPLIKDAVLSHGWLTETEFYSLVGICESTPGPIAVNMATYIGTNQCGILGGAVATLGVILPSFIIILLIATLFGNLTKNRFFTAFMKGVKPVVVGLVLSVGAGLLIRAVGFSAPLGFSFDLSSTLILLLILLLRFVYKLIFKKKMPSILMIAISAALGIGVCSLVGVIL